MTEKGCMESTLVAFKSHIAFIKEILTFLKLMFLNLLLDDVFYNSLVLVFNDQTLRTILHEGQLTTENINSFSVKNIN